MLEQLFEDLKLSDENGIKLGIRSMIWDNKNKKWIIIEPMENSDVYDVVIESFVDPYKALRFLMNPF